MLKILTASIHFKWRKFSLLKRDGPKVYRLIKLFCLKDRMFNSLVKKGKVKPASIEVMVNTQSLFAMEIENGLKFPVNTDTEILMDDLTLSPTEFMNRFKQISRWMKYPSMKQRMAFAFIQKMRLIRRH